MCERTPKAALWNLGAALGLTLVPKDASAEWIAAELDRLASEDQAARGPGLDLPTSERTDDSAEALLSALSSGRQDLLSTLGKAPLVRFLDALLFEALRLGASDIHLQPMADACLLRYRIDGVLHTIRSLPGDLSRELTGRIKVLGAMDIAEKRLPQDGRTEMSIGEREIDARISTYPSHHGERVVLRLLDKGAQTFELSALGMPAPIESDFLAAAGRSHGLVLVTGPTGSGKTTTLYATLGRIASPELNLMTIEDPIEYELSSLGLAVSQSQVHSKKGITFSTGLRHILRQDPDVILVGEIRDLDTARMAIQSSQTGHLVFSTLHTNDSVSAVTRLIDIGVEPYLVAASLSGVLAQRLVRKVHGACQGRGCMDCHGTGMRGRTGVFEFLALDGDLIGAIGRGDSLQELSALAREKGHRTLYEEGMRLVGQGLTTRAEVERVCGGGA